MARGLGQAGRRQHRGGDPVRRSGVPHPRRAAQEAPLGRQRGESAQRSG